MFPKVCVICGMSLYQKRQFICAECAQNRFEKAVTSKSDAINLPEVVTKRFALWQFDKGGYLQDLLHKLKYHRLTGVGEDLGQILGDALRKNNFIDDNEKNELVILPVPLHHSKRRKRGFNQAFYISKGMSEVLRVPILKKDVVLRIKNTKTQTGFSLTKRRENISDAFSIAQPATLTGKDILIVDDVFTTGATAFELVTELQKAKIGKIYIATVAQA